MEGAQLTWLDVPPAEARAEDAEILSDAERARCRDLSPAAATRFVFWRAATRRILGTHLGVAPQSLDIETRLGGKPVLRGGEMHFNLSHSRDCALLAVGPKPLGVDLEFAKPRDLISLAHRAFRLETTTRLESLSPQELSSWFYRRWTRVESVFKLCGGDWIPIWAREFAEGRNEWGGFRFALRSIEAPAGYFASLAESE